MRIVIVTGFLGAGKTTVLLELAKRIVAEHPESKTPVAIIENEIGDISVDDATLAGSGNYEVTSLFSGCICCSLLGKMTTSIKKLAEELDPLYAIIEPSGVADPATIAKSLRACTDFETQIVSIVDAERWDLIKKALAMIIPQQIGFASIVLLNKVDKADEEKLAAIENEIRTFNPYAPIHRVCAREGIDSSILDPLCS